MNNIKFIICIIFFSMLLALECNYCKYSIKAEYTVYDNKNYHEGCYDKHIALKCSVCNKKINGKYLEHNSKPCHEKCYDSHIALKCSICNKKINEKYLEHNSKPCHEKCYINNIAPKCDICSSPIHNEKYYIDNWGNEYHAKHTVASCNSCGRVIFPTTSNGGNRLSNNRHICGLCIPNTVKANVDIENSRNLSLQLLSKYGFGRLSDNIPIKIVTQNELCQLRKEQTDCQSTGLTSFKYIESRGRKINSEIVIYILDNLTQLEFDAVLVHEYLHVWLFENNIEYNNSAIVEGFCNLGSALVYSEDSGKIANFHLENMQNDSSPDYGIGYRKMNSCLKKYGWTTLIRKILNNDYLSCF